MRILVISMVVLVGGCATITRGSIEIVQFTSNPPGAAVMTDIGFSCPATPCQMEVSRKTPFVATFTKEGFVSGTVAVGTELSGSGAAGFAGNVIAGGVIGMAVDVSTNAGMDHKPNPVHIELQPALSRHAPAPAGRKRSAPTS